MTSRITLALTTLLLWAVAPAQDVAFVGVDVFDGTAMVRDTTVVVEGGTITALGADAVVPDGVDAIDGDGRTLLPGLFDAHVHTFYEDALRQNLIFGVTTVLDMFTDPGLAAGLREGRPADDRADFFSAGVLATAPDGHGTQFGVPVDTLTAPDQAEAWVEDRIAEGSDYIKAVLETGEELGMPQPTLDDATLRAVVDAAHERDMQVITHVQTLQAARQAIDAGTDGLAHMFVDAVPDEAFVDEAVRAGIFVIPTLTVFQTIGGAPADDTIATDEDLLPFLAPSDVQNLNAPFPGFEGLSIDHALAGVGLLHDAGVPILAGTDALNPGTAYGASLHRELVLLTEAGLTPAEALAAATSVPADVFGLEDRGVIAPDALADLLLVDGDPTEDVTATRDIVGVWKAGVRADRDAWRDALSAQREAAASQAETLQAGEATLISDFESGDAAVAFGQAWQPTTDVQAGGDSTAAIDVVPGGPEGSAFALSVAGEVGSAFAMPWAGAMFMPGSVPFGPADLSAVPVLSFEAAGDASDLRVQLFCENTAQVPGEWPFTVTESWQRFEVDLATIGDCETSAVMAIIFSAGGPGPFDLLLDDVRLERRE